MKTKLILFAKCVAALALSASVAVASPRGGPGGFNGGSRGNGFNRATRLGAPGSFRSGSRFNPAMSRNFRNFRNFRGDRFRHRGFNDFVFFGGFGDPFFYPDPYFYGYYPYGYPPYGYGYGYAPYDQSGYGYQGSGYGYQGGGYGYQGEGTGGGSQVAQLQLRLKRAGFYHGRIDGVMGPQTRYALRNYQRSHNSRDTEG